jgi:peptidoglycan hydrolase-like protein with peptidoglycan-binding domain
MKTLPLTLVVTLGLGLNGWADDRLRDVQLELKAQGFYYGAVNGQNSTETGAAIRRFQIRNGLEVTGTLTDETTKALRDGGGTENAPAPAPAPVPQQAPPPVEAERPPTRTKPPVDLRRDGSVEQSDRSFLNREEQKRAQPAPPTIQPAPPVEEEDPGSAPTPRSLEDSPDLPDVFAGTPYANAPRQVQWSTLRKAQAYLAGRGIYSDPVDGEPGPATEEALLTYQRSLRLPLTGRLDLETLSRMNLLPGRAPVPLKGFMPEQSEPRRVYRGVLVR